MYREWSPEPDAAAFPVPRSVNWELEDVYYDPSVGADVEEIIEAPPEPRRGVSPWLVLAGFGVMLLVTMGGPAMRGSGRAR